MMSNWKSGPICLDELVTVLGQYPTNSHWNGWLVPFIDPHGVQTVMAAIADAYSNYEDAPTHRWEGETLILVERDGGDIFEDRLEPDADGLYPLGAYAWVWSEESS